MIMVNDGANVVVVVARRKAHPKTVFGVLSCARDAHPRSLEQRDLRTNAQTNGSSELSHTPYKLASKLIT
jgi:hypothetical protein